MNSNDDDTEVSGAEFARLTMRDPGLVSRWKRSGKLVLSDSGKILLNASREALSKSLDPGRGGRRGGTEQAPAIAPQARTVGPDALDTIGLAFALGWASAKAGGANQANAADVEAGAACWLAMVGNA